MKVSTKYVTKERAFYASWKDPETKKDKRQLLVKGVLNTEETRSTAQTKLLEVESEIQARYQRNLDSSTLMQLFSKYKEFQSHWSSAYLQDYLGYIARAENHLGSKPISSISGHDFEQYLKSTFAAGNTANTQGNKIRTMVAYMAKHKFINSDYLADAKVPPYIPRGIKCMATDKELAQLVSVDDLLFTDSIRMLLGTGARVNEILGVKGSECNDDCSVITKGSFKTVRKGGLPYRMIPSVLQPILQRRKALYGDGFLFVDSTGRALNDATMRPLWAKYLKRCGISADRLVAGLRHAFCCQMYRSGKPEWLTAKLMGHTSVKFVQKVYSHMEAILGTFRPQLDDVWKSCAFLAPASQPATLSASQPATNVG